MDFLFWRKSATVEPELDRDPYPWIIWYIWKARNDKLFRGIDRDPLELVRYAESECQAWFNANERVSANLQENGRNESNDGSQVISLTNICMVDGSWTATAQFSGSGWARIRSAFGTGSTAMGDGEHASTFYMPDFWNGL
ncbi:uncharacterized protein LOC130494839 [Raphanus sativus]|uniref:Uncharacterized protein LOC130494839 n=1 Tax=Raphanus sativus TaxID=3726 RepID=A0A9W3BR17_RAPSA|nr:uncharacterized protein LOC130494839 [Raphanus sativus]